MSQTDTEIQKFINALKTCFTKSSGSLYDFFELFYGDQSTAETMFEDCIERISISEKRSDFVEWAKQVRNNKYKILGTAENLQYWNNVLRDRSAIKRTNLAIKEYGLNIEAASDIIENSSKKLKSKEVDRVGVCSSAASNLNYGTVDVQGSKSYASATTSSNTDQCWKINLSDSSLEVYDHNKRQMTDSSIDNRRNSFSPNDGMESSSSISNLNNDIYMQSPFHTANTFTYSADRIPENDIVDLESPVTTDETDDFNLFSMDTPIIENQDDIWSCWKAYLSNDTLHKYSLEPLGIIQCGGKLQCPSHLPEELYDLLQFNISSLRNPVSEHPDIFDIIFDHSSDQVQMLKLMDNISYEQKQDKEIGMVYAVLNIFLNTMFAGRNVTEEEADYRHWIVWPLLESVTTIVDPLSFHCGEYRLQSVDSEFERRNITTKHHYKADGCISLTLNNIRIELLLLEVSGSYNLDDEARFIKDHVKAGYGLVAMMNAIAHHYPFASFDLFSTIRVFFVQTRKNKLRLWSFEIAAAGVYILNLQDSVVIPNECLTCEMQIETLCIQLWNLKTLLESAIDTIIALQRSHVSNQRAYNRNRRSDPHLKPALLTDYLKITTDITLKADYITDYDELILRSSPF